MFTMWIVVLISFLILNKSEYTSAANCSDSWFDCGNDKCIAEIWICDGDNDCLNLKDEENCEELIQSKNCMSSQFECSSDKLCIPEKWYCDGENDCDDGSDEANCVNATSEECGFRCLDHHCIPLKWSCDGNIDCADGSDESNCTTVKSCSTEEFLCSSGSCINQSLVCNGKNDCPEGSDEGSHCVDHCVNGTCSQKCKSTPSGPQCYCEDGYTLDIKDNKTCLDVDECQEDGFCSQKCTNLPGSYMCFCLNGYELVNRTCLATGDDPLLLFTDKTDIRGLRLRSRRYFPVCKGVAVVNAVDVDPTTGTIYWVELSRTSAIYSANLDGTDLRLVLSHGLLVPEDIAVDYVARNLYLTDSSLHVVLACKMDGSMCTVLHRENVSKPRSIIVDPSEGFLYWSDWGQIAGIFRSGMDGTLRTAVVDRNVGWPNGIAMDHTLGRIYWADAKYRTIEYVTLDGSSRKVVLAGEVFHPYSMAVFEDTIYWTDWSTFSLESCNKFTGHKMTLIARENGKHVMGVHVYHPVLRTSVSNPCWSSQCSHMCLMSPSKGFRCACPPGFTLVSDQKTCSLDPNFPSLFVSAGSRVFHIRPNSVGSESISELPLRTSSLLITRVAYDSNSKTLFVADANAPAIHGINMTTQRTRDLVKSNIISPEDLSFDWTSNNLYWVDSSKGTVEVVSVVERKRATLIGGLEGPVAIAVSRSGFMFVATIKTSSIQMYDMDGKNPKVLSSASASPMSVAVHPTKSLLYWADPRAGTISFLNYTSMSTVRVLVKHLDGVMSVAASEDCIYWTERKRELNLLKGNATLILQLPGLEQGIVSRKVTYSPRILTSETFPCSIANGGCSYLCVSSPKGKTCICSVGMFLAADNKTCIDGRCKDNEFKCITNGRCLSGALRCDGKKDCEDGSDEIGCDTFCSGDDFKCRNGRCIINSWRCDRRDDCGDNSDEDDCPEISDCSKHQMLCKDGTCFPTLWRCDGETDCADGSDESDCGATFCDPENQVRCDNGQCIPISWACDGADDCSDGTDEKNCSTKLRTCTESEFQCESNGFCIGNTMKCDGRPDCEDGSDERKCPNISHNCKNGMFRCDDGHCIYDYEVCDGHDDCQNRKDELNCTVTRCQPEELHCQSPKRCILRRWICDGDLDCDDGSDEENCEEQKSLTFPSISERESASDCDGFFCYATGTCLPWSRVCDGRLDCNDLQDEGGACKKPCTGCAQVCQKTPQGSRCSCSKGYKLLPDRRTCDDINECQELGTCSHFCNNTKGGFKCSCAAGFFLHLDHRICKADGGPATLVYLLGDQIRGVDLSSHSTRVYITVQNADMRGMDYNAAKGLFYYTEKNDGSINSYSPQTHRQDVLIRSSLRPLYVRYDWIVGNLYYTDDAANIVVCTEDGKLCSTLLQSGVSYIDSLDISPTTGQMFWTIWSTVRYEQNSGLIERADMDGSHRMAIVSDHIEWPSAITVDHVLGNIYWIDVLLNTLECADFYGFNRRQIVQMDMINPRAMSVFEDYVYWADWGTSRIMRCNKFKSHDCEKIQEGNKAEMIMIVHKAMQPKGVNKCLNSGCKELCLSTRSGFVCRCRDGYVQKNDTCEAMPTSAPATTRNPMQCRKGYCLGGGECTVVRPGQFKCKCQNNYSGPKCEIEVASISRTYDYSWIVAVMFAAAVIGSIVLVYLLCKKNREKLHRVSKSVAVKFRNKMPEDRHLVMDTDEDGGACDDQLILEGREGEYRQSPFGGQSYMLAENKAGSYKRWPSCDTQSIRSGVLNFFGRQKRKDSSHLCDT